MGYGRLIRHHIRRLGKPGLLAATDSKDPKSSLMHYHRLT